MTVLHTTRPNDDALAITKAGKHATGRCQNRSVSRVVLCLAKRKSCVVLDGERVEPSSQIHILPNIHHWLTSSPDSVLAYSSTFPPPRLVSAMSVPTRNCTYYRLSQPIRRIGSGSYLPSRGAGSVMCPSHRNKEINANTDTLDKISHEMPLVVVDSVNKDLPSLRAELKRLFDNANTVVSDGWDPLLTCMDIARESEEPEDKTRMSAYISWWVQASTAFSLRRELRNARPAEMPVACHSID